MTAPPRFALLFVAVGLSTVACSSSPPSPASPSAPSSPAPSPSTSASPGPSASSAIPEGVVCTMDVKRCPDGTEVGRTGPRCEFVCPSR